eukprot:symbB.v1.2.031687.t1/scaffold3706.1/size51673/1
MIFLFESFLRHNALLSTLTSAAVWTQALELYVTEMDRLTSRRRDDALIALSTVLGAFSGNLWPYALLLLEESEVYAMELRVGGKYRLGRKIGSGSFGDIYIGTEVWTNNEVAIKLESIKSEHPQLLYESKLYKILEGGLGVPRIYWYGVEGDYNVMVLELLGPSLEDLFSFCNRKFSLKTTLMLGDQMISRVEYMHLKGFIHQDIKPDNFLIGLGKQANQVHIIDFGLAKKYRGLKKKQHIPYRENKGFTGTARYASIRAHQGIEQSRRDDLEAVGYMLIYFNGSLPWQGLKAIPFEKIKKKKMSTRIEAQHLQLDVVCYGAALASLEKDEAWQQAEALLLQMHSESLQQNLVIVNTLISAYRGHWERALHVLRASNDVDVVSYNATITACEKGSHWEEAMLLLYEVEMVKLLPDVITYSASMSACNQADQWMFSLCLFDDLQAQQIRPSSVAFNSCINSLGKGTHWHQALQKLQEMHDGSLTADILTLHVSMSACNSGKKWRYNAILLSELQQQQVRCDALTYHVSMSSCGFVSGWRWCWQHLDDLQDKNKWDNGIEATSVTFNAAVAHCERTGHWRDALFVAATALPKDLEADVILFNASIDACSSSSSWRHALHLLLEAQPWAGPYSRVGCPMAVCEKQLTSHITSLSHQKHWKSAILALDHFAHQRGSVNSVHLNAVAATSTRKAWRLTLELCSDARKLEMADIITGNTELNAFARSLHWQLSLAQLQTVRSNFLADRFSYNSALHGLEMKDVMMWGDCWFRSLDFLTCADWRMHPDMVTYTSIASSCSKALQWQSDLTLLSSLQTSAVQIDLITSNAIANSFQPTTWRQCRVLLTMMVSGALRHDAITFNTAVAAAPWTESLNCLKRCQEVFVRPNMVTWNSVVGAYAEATLWAESLLLLDQGDTITFNRVISTPCHWEIAWSYVTRMQSRSVRTDAYTLTSLMKTGTSDAQSQTWQRMLFLLNDEVTSNLEVWNAAISSCVDSSAWQYALHLFEEIRQNIGPPNVVTYGAVLAACDWGRQWSAALQFLEELDQDSLEADMVIFGSIMSACQHSQNLDLVKNLLLRMQIGRLNPNLMVANAAINCYGTSGSWEVALAVLRDFEAAKVQVDQISYNSVLNAFTSCVLWQAGLHQIEEAKTRALGVDAVSRSTMMKALGSSSDSGWRQVLNLMLPFTESLVVTNACSSACARHVSSWFWSFKCFAQLRVVNELSYNAVVNACEKGQQWSHAIHLFTDLISTISASVSNANAAISACQRQWRQAFGLLKVAENTCGTDVIGIAAVVDACRTASEWQNTMMLGGVSSWQPIRLPLRHMAHEGSYLPSRFREEFQDDVFPWFHLIQWSAEDAENNCIFRYDLLGAQEAAMRLTTDVETFLRLCPDALPANS